MKTYTPKEAAQAMLDGKVLTDGQDKYEWSDLAGCHVVVKEEIGDTSRTEATTMLLRVPDNLYDYEPEKPKVTLDEIERRLVDSCRCKYCVSLLIKTPAEPAGVKTIIQFELLPYIKYALDRIEAGAEGWEVSFCDE